MTSGRSTKRPAGGDGGAVLVLVALLLGLVLIPVGGLVVDVGNWYSHKRHLQVQADAGALAGAARFRGCPNSTPIYNTAAIYSSVENSGSTTYSGPGYNPQTGTTAPDDLYSLINSKTFYGQTREDDTVKVGAPCDPKVGMLDVKLTETDLPWFLKLAQVKYINAQARIELRRQLIGKKLIPLGVPNVEPKRVRAFFVDVTKAETDADYVIASVNLERSGTDDDRGLALWSNPTSSPGVKVPVPVNIKAANIGVRVALGFTAAPFAAATYAGICSATLVKCFNQGSASGLSNIRGWSGTTAGTLAAPKARDVELLGGTCGDGYFNVVLEPLDSKDPPNTCRFGVRATVDFGAGTFGTGATRPANVKLQAMRSGSTVKYDMTWNAGSGTWSSAEDIPLASNANGPVTIDLLWSTGCPATGNSACANTGTFAGVHRIFEGSGITTGPVESVVVSDAAGYFGANTFELGTEHDLIVEIGLSGSIQVAASVDDPRKTLKFNQGGLTGFLDCDPKLPQVSDEIAAGCGPLYKVNAGNPCPVAGTPLQCVPVEPGNKVGLLAPGLNLRILGNEKPGTNCTSPNNWAGYENGLPEGDPRIVQMFVTPQDAFAGSGSGQVPILDFAAFYVTGWQGVGSGQNPCQGKGDDAAETGEIVGHFIKYIDLANPEGAGEEICDFSSLSPCVTVFTR